MIVLILGIVCGLLVGFVIGATHALGWVLDTYDIKRKTNMETK